MTLRDPEYCPYCGTELEPVTVEGRERGRCPEDDVVIFRHAYATAEVAVVDAGRVLFVERGSPPDAGTWALPGGHLAFDEDPAAGAARELAEETGLRVDAGDLTPLGGRNLPGKHPDTRCLVLGYAARRADCAGEVAAADDAADAAFRDPDAFAGAAWDHSVAFAHDAAGRHAP